jgi:hypothetical protein
MQHLKSSKKKRSEELKKNCDRTKGVPLEMIKKNQNEYNINFNNYNDNNNYKSMQALISPTDEGGNRFESILNIDIFEKNDAHDIQRNHFEETISKTVPYGTSSGSDNFQNKQNLYSQNSRSDKNHSKSHILTSENLSSGYFENYQNQNWYRKDRSDGVTNDTQRGVVYESKRPSNSDEYPDGCDQTKGVPLENIKQNLTR